MAEPGSEATSWFPGRAHSWEWLFHSYKRYAKLSKISFWMIKKTYVFKVGWDIKHLIQFHYYFTDKKLLGHSAQSLVVIKTRNYFSKLLCFNYIGLYLHEIFFVCGILKVFLTHNIFSQIKLFFKSLECVWYFLLFKSKVPWEKYLDCLYVQLGKQNK